MFFETSGNPLITFPREEAETRLACASRVSPTTEGSADDEGDGGTEAYRCSAKRSCRAQALVTYRNAPASADPSVSRLHPASGAGFRRLPSGTWRGWCYRVRVKRRHYSISMNDSIAYAYIMASISRVLYIGSTVDLEGRVRMHKEGSFRNAFTKKYRCTKLVYYEAYEMMEDARQREWQLKRWRREKKIKLIESVNPHWIDCSLYLDRERDAE